MSSAVGRIAAIVALGVAAVVVALLLFGGGSSYEITAEFENASQLVPGSQVVVAGVPLTNRVAGEYDAFWTRGGGTVARVPLTPSLAVATRGGDMFARSAFAAAAFVVMTACGSADQNKAVLSWAHLLGGRDSSGLTTPRAKAATVPKATCGPLDRPETGLQGQTPLADRQSGASTQAYNCNLEKVGQFEGEGASWQLTWFNDCAYYDTANTNTPAPQHPGTVVVDVSDPEHPKATDYLTGAAMLDPWESLKVNPQRKLLGANKGPGFTVGASGFQVNPADDNFTFYDISDCKHPKFPVTSGTPAISRPTGARTTARPPSQPG